MKFKDLHVGTFFTKKNQLSVRLKLEGRRFLNIEEQTITELSRGEYNTLQTDIVLLAKDVSQANRSLLHEEYETSATKKGEWTHEYYRAPAKLEDIEKLVKKLSE